MKIKQFFVDNKDKINTIFENVLAILIFIVIVFSVYSCGFYQGSYLESSEEANKKELVNRKEANNTNTDFNFKLVDDLALVENLIYYDNDYMRITFISDVYLRDEGIYFDYNNKLSFPNNAEYSIPGNYLISYDDFNNSSIIFNSSSNIDLGMFTSSYFPLYALDDSDGLIWEIGFEMEFEVYTNEFDEYYYFDNVFSVDISYLVADDVWFENSDSWVQFFTTLTSGDADTNFDGLFYTGINPITFYNLAYDEGFHDGFDDGLYSTSNLFQSEFCKLLIKQGYLYKSYGESDSTLGNGYFNKELFFKGNYLDFTYLYEALRVDGLFQSALEFMISFNSNIRFYLTNLNLKVVPSDASPTTPVENLNLQVRTEGQLGESSVLFEFLEYDKLYRFDNRNLISSIWFNSSWPDSEVYLYNVMTYEVDSYNKGFDSGYDKGYSNGYSEAERDQEDYYEELIIPSIKNEYYDLGLAEGRAQSNAILKPFELMAKGVEPVILVLSSEIAPGITIGTIALIPLAVTMIVFLLKGLVL